MYFRRKKGSDTDYFTRPSSKLARHAEMKARAVLRCYLRVRLSVCFPCPCCGYRTLADASPSYATCEVCWWTDVPADEWKPNEICLSAAQENFVKHCAAKPEWYDNVRFPADSETRDPAWRSLRERRAAALPQTEREIHDAFAHVRLEGGVTLHQMDVLDGYGGPEELAKAARLDPEETWQEISHGKVSQFGQSLVFFDAKGFRFHIPAFMCAILRDILAGVHHHDWAGVWYGLGDSPYSRERHYPLLTEAQKRAIARFVLTVHELGDIDEASYASECVEYWRAFS
jgi:hypothetical protein